MSLALTNARQLYRKAFAIELIFLFILTALCAFLAREQLISFFLGSLVAFLPQIGFIGFALYLKKNEPVTHKAKVLYQSEGLKLVLTVGLFIAAFLCFNPKPAGLFIGYFIFILLNNLLPIALNMKH
ncbi:F0F1-type ATP synthase assembly protein I [Pasteurella langaaensis DSM 22999]|uniref:F0F1-type ATP synthase assembly protein I n=1 Tax=Alitibacter langaaensis DSM 22999 TaxID=1122935 RepID=A0A2U0T6L4_9PAST|nr:ATP synthase subunit I [Pasteurella langaaensis]PVX39246.1 F0F1-type ATP synthase assembly protein I [Pasteurella langaaensis DSM 22999]